MHQNLALAGLGNINHLLDHIVGVLILHHDVERGAGTVGVGGADLLDEDSSLRSVSILNTLLHHVAGELVLRQMQYFSSNTRD